MTIPPDIVDVSMPRHADELLLELRWARTSVNHDKRGIGRSGQRRTRGPQLWLVVSVGMLCISSLAMSISEPLRGRRPRPSGQRASEASGRNRDAPAIAVDRAVPAGALQTPAISIDAAQIETVFPGTSRSSGRLAAIWKRYTVDRGAWLAAGSAGTIAVAELLTATDPLVGMVLHAVVLLALIVIAAETASSAVRRFALALALAPLTRIVSLGIPTERLETLSWYVVVAVTLFAASLAVIRALGLTPAEINLRMPEPRAMLASIAIVLSGVGVGIAEFAMLRPEAISSVETPQSLLLAVIVLMIPIAFFEEFMFRGILQTGAAGMIGRGPAIVFAAFVFGSLHLGQAPLLHVMFVTIASVAFGWFVVWTNSLYPVVVAHGLANVMLFIVLPLRFG